MERLAAYDIIAAIDVRTLLRTLRFEPGDRRLGELGPPQKTRTINRSGRALKITTSLLVQGSCGICRPFADARKMRAYLTGRPADEAAAPARSRRQVALRPLSIRTACMAPCGCVGDFWTNACPPHGYTAMRYRSTNS